MYVGGESYNFHSKRGEMLLFCERAQAAQRRTALSSTNISEFSKPTYPTIIYHKYVDGTLAKYEKAFESKWFFRHRQVLFLSSCLFGS